ncbi:MAG: hypothetical protein J6Y18_01220 [Candidatus Methanomethylophilaceae archaeon]|nr:hypothetical protein [Candidatus Methanomethylophilaceae archaeon]
MENSLRKALDSGEWIDSKYRMEYDAAIFECGMKVQRYNATPMTSIGEMRGAFEDITQQKLDAGSLVVFPFRCDLGFNVHIGKDVIVNYNCTFLDTASITIGDHSKIGPDCHLVTAVHPKDHT